MGEDVGMAKSAARLRQSTSAERWAEIAWLVFGGAYSIAFWAVNILGLWVYFERLLFG